MDKSEKQHFLDRLAAMSEAYEALQRDVARCESLLRRALENNEPYRVQRAPVHEAHGVLKKHTDGN